MFVFMCGCRAGYTAAGLLRVPVGNQPEVSKLPLVSLSGGFTQKNNKNHLKRIVEERETTVHTTAVRLIRGLRITAAVGPLNRSEDKSQKFKSRLRAPVWCQVFFPPEGLALHRTEKLHSVHLHCPSWVWCGYLLNKFVVFSLVFIVKPDQDNLSRNWTTLKLLYMFRYDRKYELKKNRY